MSSNTQKMLEVAGAQKSTQALLKSVGHLHDMIKDGLIKSDEEMKKIFKDLQADNEADDAENKAKDTVKKLQMVIATFHDKHGLHNETMKSMSWRLNILSGQIMEMASRNDQTRNERAFSGLTRSQSVPGLSLPMSSTGGYVDLASNLNADIQAIRSTAAVQSDFPYQAGPTFNYWKRLDQMLKISGTVEQPQMTMLLGIWESTAARDRCSLKYLLNKASHFLQGRLSSLGTGSSEDAAELIDKAKLLDTPWQDQELTSTKAFNLVMASIPKEEWLTFARNELKMSEADIAEVKRHSTPTAEQLRQINLAQDAWKRAHGISE